MNTARNNLRPLRVVEQEPPNDPQAEAVVLGTLIDFPERMDEVADQLAPEDFYTNRHRAAYEVMLSYYHKHGHGADYLTLCALLERRDDLDASDLLEFSLLRGELWSSNLAQDIKLITGPAQQRRTSYAAQQLYDIALRYPDPEESRQQVEKLLYELTLAHAPASDFESLEDILGECAVYIEMAWKNKGKLLGITTGFPDLNRMTDGLQRSDLVLLAGRPADGKTSLGLGIGYHAALAGHAVAVFSLEMGKKQLGTRLLSMISGIPSNRLRAGWLDDDEWKRVTEAQMHLSELCMSIDDTAGTPISSIRGKLRRLKAKLGREIDLVIVDYLQLMEDEDESSSRRENRNQEISKISRGLKKIAREFNVPVLALAQLNRAVEGRTSKIPQLSDLRESGSLEQDADIVMFVRREEGATPEAPRTGTAFIIIAKQRNGPVGTISLHFDPKRTRFDSIDFTSKPAWNDGREVD